jgi:hypothetical protein
LGGPVEEHFGRNEMQQQTQRPHFHSLVQVCDAPPLLNPPLLSLLPFLIPSPSLPHR